MSVEFPRAGGQLDRIILKVSCHPEDSMMVITHLPGVSHLLLCCYYIGQRSHNAEGHLIRSQFETIFKERNVFLVWTRTTCLVSFQWSCITAEFGQLERKYSANILPTPASLSPVMRVLQTVCSILHSHSFVKARNEHFGFKGGVSDMPPRGSGAANTPLGYTACAAP